MFETDAYLPSGGCGVIGDGHTAARCAPEQVEISCPVRLARYDSGATPGEVKLIAGARVWISAAYGAAAPPSGVEADAALERTLEFRQHRASLCAYDGAYLDLVLRGALVVKAMIYAPTGALLASVTASLPDWVGGFRNFDHRYSRLRDGASTLQAGWWTIWPSRARSRKREKHLTTSPAMPASWVGWRRNWIPWGKNYWGIIHKDTRTWS